MVRSKYWCDQMVQVRTGRVSFHSNRRACQPIRPIIEYEARCRSPGLFLERPPDRVNSRDAHANIHSRGNSVESVFA